MKYKYYRVNEYQDNEVRRVYTFIHAADAYDLVEFILQRDNTPIDLRVEEYEADE